jgi:hypothetical protein
MAKHSVILFHGKAGSGKTTSASAWQTELEKRGIPVKRLSFAIPVYKLHDMIQGFMAAYGYPPQKKHRKLLQIVGTELGRGCYGNEVWARAGLKEAELYLAGFPDRDATVIFDDMRFPEEFTAADHLWGQGIEVHKISLSAPEEVRKVRADKWPENPHHPSETGLDDWTGRFDMVINTTNGVEQALEELRRYFGGKDGSQ